MFNINSFQEYVLFTYKESVYLFTRSNKLQVPVFEYKHADEITASTYLPKKNIVVISDTNKKLFILDAHTKNVLTNKNVVKRAYKFVYDRNELNLLIADKTGDVYRLILDDLNNNEVELLMGHLSMLTDIKLTSDEKYLLTSDRDEKIRISHFENAYNIQSYLLGHKEFVTQIELINEIKLISSSGDSNLIVWNLITYKVAFKINVTKFIKSTLPDFESKGISHFEFDKVSNQLLVLLFGCKYLMAFKYENDEIKFVSLLDLNVPRIDYFIHLFSNHYIFVLGNKFSLKNIQQFQMSENENDEKLRNLVSYLNENINLDDARHQIELEYQSLFKNIIYSNVEMYYERKMERINSTVPKKLRNSHQQPVEASKTTTRT